MKKLYISALVLLVLGMAAFTYPVEKLMDPINLVEIIKNPSAKKPLILNVGPSPNIPGSVVIGNGAEPENIERLKRTLKDVAKDKEIVMYCGCCKLEDCININEADKVMKNLNFTNYKILNLPTDFEKDWKEKNYPIQ